MDPTFQDYTALRQAYVPPQHRTDGLANAVFRPSTYALLDTMTAGGSRQNKLRAGTGSYAYWSTFRGVNRMIQNGISSVGQRYPKVGQFMEAHPVATAIPAMVVGIGVASVPAAFARKITHRIFDGVDNTRGGGTVIDKALYNAPMDGLAKLTAPLGRVLKKPAVRGGLGLGFVGLAGITLYNYFKDLSAVGRHNRDVQSFERQLSPTGDQFTLQDRLATRNIIDV